MIAYICSLFIKKEYFIKMKKANYILISLLGLLLISASCNKKKTYAELLKDEAKAIDRFITSNKLSILKEFPKDGKFKENEFYKDPATGVYYNILKVGDTTNLPKIKSGNEVHVRFRGLKYFSIKNDSTEYSNLNSSLPESFTYRGSVNLETRSYYSSTVGGWAVPLQNIGHTGKVKMIVPFTWGSQTDKQSYTPTYYDSVEYRWIN